MAERAAAAAREVLGILAAALPADGRLELVLATDQPTPTPPRHG